MPSAIPTDRTPLTFTFRNIGPIENAELELGDLTIIAGRNNTGKTYLVYTLYGFLTAWEDWRGPSTRASRARAPAEPPFEPHYPVFAQIRRQKSEVYEDRFFNDIKKLMNGYYAASNDAIEFRSAARGDRRFAIPLHLASSSARGLSDLYFFLRHVARKNHLLIIDEPESHLDTTNQIQLARLLARLVRAGLKVLLTTHSDYLIKELNNLIMLSSSFDNKAKVVKRLKYAKEDCIAPEKIRAYIATGNSLTRCEIDKFGIDMPNFDETINDINDAASELAARLAGIGEAAGRCAESGAL